MYVNSRLMVISWDYLYLLRTPHHLRWFAKGVSCGLGSRRLPSPQEKIREPPQAARNRAPEELPFNKVKTIERTRSIVDLSLELFLNEKYTTKNTQVSFAVNLF